MRPRTWLAIAAGALASACSPPARSGTDAAMAGIADSAQAREAVRQYLDALAARDYARAAHLFAGDWRGPAAHVLGDSAGTLSLAAFLEQSCTSGYYVCGLRVRRFTGIRFTPPDTFMVGLEYADSAGARFTWGPCCGGAGLPDSVGGVRAVARDSGYAVLDLPLYIP